jgi:holo-[acyl-carrier protein] synthase
MSRTPSGELLAVGVDIVDIGELRRLLSYPGDRLRRVFSPSELALLKGSTPEPDRSVATRLAVSFAAKEAVFKALGRGWGQGTEWSDVSLLRNEEGRWSVSLRGKTGQRLSEIGGGRVEVCACHWGTHALAQAVIFKIPTSKSKIQNKAKIPNSKVRLAAGQ